MKCQRCGKPAKRFTVKKKNGEVVVELCESCYKRLYGDGDIYCEEKNAVRKECPACGTTYDDFRRTSLMGCAECYKAFRAELTPVLGYIQRSAQHVGKVPAGAGEAYDDLRGMIVREDLRERFGVAEKEHDERTQDALRARLLELEKRARRGEK